MPVSDIHNFYIWYKIIHYCSLKYFFLDINGSIEHIQGKPAPYKRRELQEGYLLQLMVPNPPKLQEKKETFKVLVNQHFIYQKHQLSNIYWYQTQKNVSLHFL